MEPIPIQQWQITDNWLLTGQCNRIMDRGRSTSNTREPIDDYQITNIMLHTDFNVGQSEKIIGLSLIIKNLFDTDANEPSDGKVPGDFPLSGHQLYAELTYNF